MTAPLHAFEEARLATLLSLGVLDTLPEEEFEGIVGLACALLDVPMALVSLIDRDRQWFKAKAGLDVCETSRDLAFCAHAILQTAPLVVPDAALDARFADNPLVTGEFGLRFYAGAPIMVEGHAVGTVCCLDRIPRTPTDRQIDALAALASQAGALLLARRRAAEFAESERRFVAFLDHAPALAFLKDAEGRMRFANRRHAEVFDYEPGAILGLRDHDRMPHEFAERLREFDNEVRRTGVPVERDEIVPLPDGSPLVWQVLKFPIEIEGQTWIGGMAVDVTEQRAAEATIRTQAVELSRALKLAERSTEAARHSAVRFEQLFDGLPVACYTHDAEGNLFEYNAAAETLWSIPSGEAYTGSIYDTLICPANHEAKRASVARVFAGEAIHDEEWRETLRDGSTRWILTNTFPMRNSGGEIVGAVSANVDVTERKRMEESIRSSEERLRTVLDSLHEGVVVQDAPGKVTLWNRSAERILGVGGDVLDLRSERDPRSRAFREDGSDFPIEERPVALAIRDGRPHEATIGMDHSSGERRWHSVIAVPLAGPEGGPPQTAVASFLDVTERMRMESDLRASEERFRTVIESLHEGLIVQDETGQTLLWNRSAERLLGLNEDDLLGRTERFAQWRTVREDGSPLPGEERPAARVLKEGVANETTMGVFDLEGEPRWINVHAAPVVSDDGKARAVVASFLDVTERKRMEEEIRSSEERFRTVVESLHEGLVVQDREGRIVLWNRSAERILGLTGEELVGRRSVDPRWRTVREDGSPFPGTEHPSMVALRTGEPQAPTLMGVHRPEGGLRWITVNATPIMREGDRPRAAVASFLDVTERVEQERRISEHLRQIEAYSAELEEANGRLEALANTDGLTGLKNHRFFQDALRRKIEHCRGAGLPISLALLDVDKFKAYNDDFGHQAGDAVLRRVADVLGRSVRASDIVARYGGEEFVIVIPGLDADGAVALAGRVREGLAATPFELRSVTASFGVSTLGPFHPDATAMIRAADEALYRSKAEGRNRVTHWESLDPAFASV